MNRITLKVTTEDLNNVQKYLKSNFTDISINITPDDVLVRDALVNIILELLNELKDYRKAS